MATADELRRELEAKRAELKKAFEAAQRDNNSERMAEARALAGQIDDRLDDLAFEEFRIAAERIRALKAKIDTFTGQADDLSVFLPGGRRRSGATNENDVGDGEDSGRSENDSAIGHNDRDLWSALLEKYKKVPIEYPHLKPVTVAQWINESARGTSELATKHNNFAGIKWRTPLQPFGRRVHYVAHDGPGYYCHFTDLDSFIAGYWAFLERDPYEGWRDHTFSPEAFIKFVGPIWAENTNYVDDVLKNLAEAEDLLRDGDGQPSEDEWGDGDDGLGYDYRDSGSPSDGSLLAGRPSVRLDRTGDIAIGGDGLTIDYEGSSRCPYGRSATRSKQPFAAMVIHHTTDRHDTDWYVRYQIRGDSGRGGHHFGYHFYISPEGRVVQGAPFSKRTNHVKPSSSIVRRDMIGRIANNNNSIGISCVGAWNNGGFNPTAQQKRKTEELVFALADLFSIPFDRVFGHGEIQSDRKKVEGTIIAKKIRNW